MPKTPQLSFTGGELSPHIYSRIDIARYTNGTRLMRNFMLHEYGGVSNRPGTEFIGEVATPNTQSRLIPFSFNTQETYVLELSNQKMRIIQSGGLIVYPTGHTNEGQIVEITSPYNATDLNDVKFAQSADILTLCHPSYPVYELARTDHHEWTFTQIPFEPALDAPTSTSATGYGGGTETSYKYIITAVAENGEESIGSSPASCVNRYDMNLGTGHYNKVTWDTVISAQKYNIYRYDDYDGYSYGYLGSTTDLEFIDQGSIEPDIKDAPPEIKTPFDGTDKYPSCLTYYKQRLCFGRSNSNPQTLWMTQTANYKNMNVSTPRRADDAIEYTLAGNQVNEIRHIIPLKDLVILTSGGEWTMSTGGQALSAEHVDFIHESVNGSSHIPPLIINNSILYINPGNNKVRDLFYKFEDDGYSGEDLTIFSRHLFENRKLTQWCFQNEPHHIIWATTDDGILLGLTYNREHQVWGWHQHSTINGRFESVCCVQENGIDTVYLCTRRTVGGQEKYYIEKMHTRIFKGTEDAHFVDCGVIYDGIPTKALNGLDHLEGEEIAILADGNVHPSQTVINGSITLKYEAEKIHAGLPITAELETLDIHFSNYPAFGQKRNIHSVTLFIKDTRGLWVGPNAENLVEHKQRKQSDGYAPIPLQTDEISIPITPDWGSNGRLFITQKDPIPATILSVTPEFNIADE